MAVYRSLFQSFRQKLYYTASISFYNVPKRISCETVSSPLKIPCALNLVLCRFTHTYLARLPASELWKGVTCLSPAGRRKGRGKSRQVARDLNRGQILGVGKKNMVWPGLNAPVILGRELVRQHELPPDESREKRLIELRNKFIGRKSFKVHPLERGWCGNKLPGRSLGPPDPVGNETFEGFDSRVLMLKTVTHMHGQRGRIRSLSTMVVVGNKKGLAGFGLAKGTNGNSAVKSAKNRAAKLLRYIELDNDTVIHDFYTEFGACRLFVEKRPQGYGLVCHRCIRAICQVLGIKDIYVKCEGSVKNYLNITRAFFIGLMNQKSLQQIADEKGLHLVEMRCDRDYFPVVKASPQKCRTEKEILPTEIIDVAHHLHKGKVVEPRKKYEPFFIKFKSYIKEMKDRERFRNSRQVKVHLASKYGTVKSFLTIKEEQKSEHEVRKAVES